MLKKTTITVMLALMLMGANRVKAQSVPYYCNLPLPYLPASLNILFIGNSFSIDTSAALPSILQSLSISNVNVYVLYKGSCSMKQHCENFQSGKKVYELYRYYIGGEEKKKEKVSIREAMEMNTYDVVIFQQYSLESGQYESYEPYLAQLIRDYKLVAMSPRTSFAFNQTWAYSSKHKNISKYGSRQKMYESIVDACKKMKAKSGVDIIIPCGTAVENARNCKDLVIENELTRDNQHIDLYMGRYLLACTFFDAIISPCICRNLYGDISVYGKVGASNRVNSTNRRILQECAKMAVANNWEISY